MVKYFASSREKCSNTKKYTFAIEFFSITGVMVVAARNDTQEMANVRK